MSSISDKIHTLLKNSLVFDEFDTDTDLVDLGLIDSAGFMDLFALLEAEFDIAIGLADLSLDHFRTVKAMTAFVTLKQNERT